MANLQNLQKKANNMLNSNIRYCFGDVCLSDKGWYFKGFDRATKRAGVCSRKFKNGRFEKSISLSKLLMQNFTEKEALETLTHEIAHAIDIEYRNNSNHDNIWKKIHKSIGGDGERCYSLTKEIKEIQKTNYKYVGICKKCGKQVKGWLKKPKYFGVENYYSHIKCGGSVEIKKIN